MINDKNFIYYFIPYLTVSCGLYHIVYWGRFGLNGLSLISVEDIIKTAVPSITFTFLGSIFGYFITHKIFNSKIEVEKNKKILLIRSLLLFVLYSIIYYSFNSISESYSFEMGSFFISLIIVDCIDVDFIFENTFGTKINKELCLLMLIYFPLNSIGTAFSRSNDILNNTNFLYAVKSNNEDLKKLDTLKLIGNENDNFIFINLKNEKIYFIKNDTIELLKK